MVSEIKPLCESTLWELDFSVIIDDMWQWSVKLTGEVVSTNANGFANYEVFGKPTG